MSSIVVAEDEARVARADDYTRSSRRNIRTLTSLRFFAAAIIVLGHMRGHFGIPSDWSVDFPHYLGVSFFFVLSGFILCLSYPALGTRSAKARYLLARIARIWPLHAFTFLLFCLMSILTVEGYAAWMTQARNVRTAVLNLLLLQAWVPWSGVALSYNGVSWSISAEAFFYVSFLWLLPLRTARWYVLPLVGLAPAVVLMVLAQAAGLPRYALDLTTVSKDMLLYINPAARLFEFTVGMATARLFDVYGARRPGILVGTLLEALAVALLAFALTVMTYSTFATGTLGPILPDALGLWLERCGSGPIFAAAIFIFAMERGWISRLLHHRLLILGGEISYAIYLTHLIFLYAVTRLFEGPPALLSILFVGCVLAASYLCWRYVEMPARAGIMRLAGQPPGRVLQAQAGGDP